MGLQDGLPLATAHSRSFAGRGTRSHGLFGSEEGGFGRHLGKEGLSLGGSSGKSTSATIASNGHFGEVNCCWCCSWAKGLDICVDRHSVTIRSKI